MADLNADEQTVAEVLERHSTSLLGLGNLMASWTCQCGATGHGTRSSAIAEGSRHGASAILAALDLPGRDMRIREEESDRLAALDIETSTASPLHSVWTAAIDAATSGVFRVSPGQCCEECWQSTGELDEGKVLRYQRNVITRADAAIRADERAKVRAELLAIAEEAMEDNKSAGAMWMRWLADRIAPEVDHDQPA